MRSSSLMVSVLSYLMNNNANPKSPIPLNQIAADLHLRSNTVRTFLRKLQNRGLVSSRAGANGGYYLLEKPTIVHFDCAGDAIVTQIRNLDQLKKMVYEKAEKWERVVTDIRVNNISVLRHPRVIPLRIDFVEVETESFSTLAVYTIREGIDVLPNLEVMIKKCISSVNDLDKNDVKDEIDYCVNGVHWAFNVLKYIEKWVKKEYPYFMFEGETFNEHLIAFGNLCNELKAMVKEGKLKDVAHYIEKEVLPALSRVKSLLRDLYQLHSKASK